MGKIYNYDDINNLTDLRNMKAELKISCRLQETKIKHDVKEYIHQFTPGYLVSKYTRKPKEKVTNAFSKVKSWFSGRKKKSAQEIAYDTLNVTPLGSTTSR